MGSNLWQRLDAEARLFIRNSLLSFIETCENKLLLRKACNLVVEVAGAYKEVEGQIWQDLLNLIFRLV